MIKAITSGFCFLILLLNTSCGQTLPEELDELISTYATYGQFNGSVLVAKEGEVVYKKGFGLANMEWDIPNQTNTRFRLASVTKQFTAMLIMQLVAEGKLDVHSPLSSYLPDYPGTYRDSVTIHQLLTHTSGIPSYTSFRGFWEMERYPKRPEQMIQYFADSTLHFPPGAQYEYSNSGYFLLGYLIEKVSSKTYEEVLQEEILRPLKMEDSGYDHNWDILKNRASGYEGTVGVFHNAGYTDMTIPYAAGAMYSTVEDLYRWDQALYTEQLLPQTYLDQIFEKHISKSRGHYGYGWEISDLPIGNTGEEVPVTMHGGGIQGFNTLIVRIPSERSLIVLLNNTGRAPLYEMAVAINGILHETSYDLPKRSVAQALLAEIQKGDLTTATLFYEQIKNDTAYYLDEREMNLAGYSLLEKGQLEAAATIFKLNVEAFPESFNVYDSYAETLMKLGNKEEAIENYRRSIQLNPNNNNGIQMLKKLEDAQEEIIFFSFDQGLSWENKSSGLPSTTSIGLGGIAASDHQLALLTKDAGLYFFNTQNDSWQHIPTDQQLLDNNPGALIFYQDALYAGTQTGGVFYSKNKGKYWSTLNAGLENLTIRKFAVIEQQLYAATNSGLYRYRNNSHQWNLEFGNKNLQVNGITTLDGHIYIATNQGAFASTIDQKNWKAVFTDGALHNISAADGALYALAYNELFSSTDQGKNWHNIQQGFPPQLYTFNVIQTGPTLLAGQWDGVYRKAPQAETWKLSSQGLPKQLAFPNMLVYDGMVVVSGGERKLRE